jgi:hypothetical protein
MACEASQDDEESARRISRFACLNRVQKENGIDPVRSQEAMLLKQNMLSVRRNP